MYSTFQLVSLMSLEFAMTKAGINTLSIVNLPDPANSTAVALSINMVREISMPIRMSTGQSTTSVNAEFLAASNARATPAESSDVPLQLTQLLMDFLAVAAACVPDVFSLPPSVPAVDDALVRSGRVRSAPSEAPPARNTGNTIHVAIANSDRFTWASLYLRS